MRSTRGITLIEMLIVLGIIAVAGAIAFPAVTSGIDTLRLSSATDATVSFLNQGLNRAERRQELVEVIISKPRNTVTLRGEDPGFFRRLDMPETVTIVKIHPEMPGFEDDEERRYVLYPGGTIPRFGIELANRRGVHRIVRVDPITGVPRIESVQ